MSFDFEGRVALVTGGTSGIGLATARLLLASGAKVMIAGRHVVKGKQALKSLAEFGDHVQFVRTDVAKTADCMTAVESASRWGRLDIVVNSAGMYLEKPISETSEAEFRRIMDVNLTGTYFVAKYSIPELRRAGGGVIVNVSSDAGLNGNNLCSAYCASKGAVTVFTKALALEVAHWGIRVNCVCPGDVDTPMLEKQLTLVEDPMQQMREMSAVHPLGRVGTAIEIAEVIRFLASDAASFVTGAAWTVDGGLTAQ